MRRWRDVDLDQFQCHLLQYLFAVPPVRRDLFAVSPARRDLFAVPPVRRDLFAVPPVRRDLFAVPPVRRDLCIVIASAAKQSQRLRLNARLLRYARKDELVLLGKKKRSIDVDQNTVGAIDAN
jgi:hypothetical protein